MSAEVNSVTFRVTGLNIGTLLPMNTLLSPGCGSGALLAVK